MKMDPHPNSRPFGHGGGHRPSSSAPPPQARPPPLPLGGGPGPGPLPMLGHIPRRKKSQTQTQTQTQTQIHPQPPSSRRPHHTASPSSSSSSNSFATRGVVWRTDADGFPLAEDCGVGRIALDVVDVDEVDEDGRRVAVARPSRPSSATRPSSSSLKAKSSYNNGDNGGGDNRDDRRKSTEGKRRRRLKRQQSAASRGGARTKNYNFDLPDAKRNVDVDGGRCWSRAWYAFARCGTCLVPDRMIPREGDAAKLAWREKLAFFNVFLSCNVIFLIAFGVIPLYFCRESTPLDGVDWYDANLSSVCSAMNVGMYGILFLVAGLLVLQCLCSLALGVRSFLYRVRKVKNFDDDDLDEAVMIMVPCYNEGRSELTKTINSILYTDYPDDNKVMVVVADGIITGRGEDLSTPKTLAELLGFRVRKRDRGYSYTTNGVDTDNRASVYHGTCERDGRSLKYIVVIKRGTPSEKESSKPGNRGKRDSQLIALGLFNRVHHDRKLSELDGAICAAMNELEVPVTELRYLLAIDADTRISPGSISHMIYFMERNKRCLACCGETKVDNKIATWVTAIQVFEYFASHQLKKAFEGAFGCVTCLPGCFTMYRIFCDSDFHPLISDDKVFQCYRRNDIESLHEKNLYHLGEDRMLTTLLLKHFPDMRLSFVPWAVCWTIVPDTFWVLLSQRRRWINSTFHNMLELLKVRTMCGCCCLSMKLIVVLDMISTLILPASVVYATSFVYVVFWEKEPFSATTLILYGIIFGVQFLVFVVRGRLDYIFWFLVYFVLGIPVFYFVLPLYSFWRMDDLSWGSTRQVAAAPAAPAPPSPAKPQAAA